ncbi:MAG: IS630 family transposase [Trueperaceae bacterium]
MRKRPSEKPCEETYAYKREALAELERLSQASLIDLYYADESRVCLEPCVPYAWQFPDEDVFLPSMKSKGLNCLGLLSRNNKLLFTTTTGSITSAFVFDYLERLSLMLDKPTVIVLDNAPVHTAKLIQERRKVWEERGLTLFYLPPYSPQLNLIEILWRMLKYYWLNPEDYAEEQLLFYKVTLALAAVGSALNINFSDVALV